MATPGMLLVRMQPHPSLSLAQFHEWYNNEHGPARLRLPHIFSCGLRYRATDDQKPAFLAAWDVRDMPQLETPAYTSLRANRSSREAAVFAQVDVNRSFFDLVMERTAPHFVPANELTDEAADGQALIVVELPLRSDVEGAEDAVMAWYEEEHVSMLEKVPGWLRSRVFRTPSKIETGETGETGERKIVALHDFAKVNGLGGPEHQASTATPMAVEMFTKYIGSRIRRTYELDYVLGSAPRDLYHLSRLSPSASFVSEDGLTSTTISKTPTSGTEAVIQSYVTTPDGLRIPYRLEGNPSPDAPTVAFCNSLLSSLHMWDPLVVLLKQHRPDLRLLRYDMRGRHALPQPPVPATMDALADDVAFLLRALRLPHLHALVGVSIGGATSLKFALKYPTLVARFIACDFSVTSEEAGETAWKERIAMAEGVDDEGEMAGQAQAGSGMRKLARKMAAAILGTRAVQEKPDVVAWLADMMGANDVQGFRYSCQALWDYNFRDEMRECLVPGLFVVGEEDMNGTLATAMDGFKGLLGEQGAELKIIPATGHLPMVEWPEKFWEAIKGFL